jgi:hypothetical protein
LLGNSRQFGTSNNAVLHQTEKLIRSRLAVLASATRLSIKDSIPDTSV